MANDLHDLGQELTTTAGRIIRWVPTDGLSLSLSAARILARLSDSGPTRISALAARERSSQPTMTNHIKRLEAAGLVSRSADPHDARAWMIDLTPTGRERLAQLRNQVGTNVEPFLAGLTKRDLKALRDGISAMQRLMAVDKVNG